jgi:hypothetical protein
MSFPSINQPTGRQPILFLCDFCVFRRETGSLTQIMLSLESHWIDSGRMADTLSITPATACDFATE